MKLRQLFVINLVIALFFGLVCSLLPRQLFALYGLSADPGGIWTIRLVGGSILGFATLMWFGTRTASGEARRAVAYALLVQDAIGLIASLEIQPSGAINPLGLTNPALYFLLAFGYAYSLFMRPAYS
jgi:hypothetical protein